MKRFTTLVFLFLFCSLFVACAEENPQSQPSSEVSTEGAQNEKPHAVFVLGTHHYKPKQSLIPLAKQLEENFGFQVTIVSSEKNPENDLEGLSGLEALDEADVAIFFTRFLTLPEDQFAFIQRYLESGKPVVAFRTTTHGFNYGKDHALRPWNDDFGSRAMGTKYFIHGYGTSDISVTELGKAHEILTGFDTSTPRTAGGMLYLSELPEDATVLMTGEGRFKKTGEVKNRFGTHQLAETMTDDVTWIWENEWGGRVFGTTLGHVDTFADENFMRLFINGIHWAAGKDIPSADTPVSPIEPIAGPKKSKK